MKYIVGLIVMFSSLFGYSQVEFTASVNYNKVAVNEVFIFELTSSVNGTIYQPDFSGFQVLGRPNQSNSSRMIVVNGKRTVVRSLKYSWNLRVNKKGKHILPSTIMEYNGKKYKTKPITITVLDPSKQPKIKATSDFFVRISTSKKVVFQGEPFVVSLKMYSRAQPRGIEDIKFGEANGLTKKDLNPNKVDFDTRTENINGVNYFTVVLKRELCYAQKLGEIKIEPYYLSALFQRNIFQQYRQEGSSNSLTINCKKMPGQKPKNFNGLVGQFKLNHAISKTNVKVNEAIDLSISISGKGNLNQFDDPVLNLPNDFDQFDPEIKKSVKTTSTGVEGKMTFNFVIVPTFYGDYEIPAYSFSYFDINSKKYKTLTTGAIKLHVDKPDGEAGEIVKKKKSIEIAETDIRFAHLNNSKSFKNSDLNANTFLHYFLVILPFLGLWLFLFIKNRKNNLSDSDKIKVTSKRAKKGINKYLLKSKKLHADGNDDEAVKELALALRSYLKNKLNLTENDLNKNTILSRVTDENAKIMFSKCWGTIEMYQYAPINASEVDVLINDTEALINLIDEKQG